MYTQETQEDKDLFQKIKNNPKPDVLDLWMLSDDKFTEWRRLNDLPKLLKHFDKTLLLFKEWKIENKLSDDIIINSKEITPYLEKKKFVERNKLLHLNKQKINGQIEYFVGSKIEKKQNIEEEINDSEEYVLSFLSYLDWLNERKLNEEILAINYRDYSTIGQERVFIHSNPFNENDSFELLQMGGITINSNNAILLFRSVKFEFVNLSGLKFEAENSIISKSDMFCSFCACDKWSVGNVNLPVLKLENCSVKDSYLLNSKLNHSTFYDCDVSGDFTNSKLDSVYIIGGNFNADIQNCSLLNSHVMTTPNVRTYNLQKLYKLFKIIYLRQNDYDLANSYYLKEHELIRENQKGWNYFTKSLSYYYWEYGLKPHKIIYYSISLIFCFALIYWLRSDLISANTKNTTFNLLDSLYFSIITFTTLGYGDFSPVGSLRIFSAIEAFLGVINMGFLISGYTNNKY